MVGSSKGSAGCGKFFTEGIQAGKAKEKEKWEMYPRKKRFRGKARLGRRNYPWRKKKKHNQPKKVKKDEK